MWVPRQAVKAGTNFQLRYRLHWASDEPDPPALARCCATRLGRGGEPGKPHPDAGHWRASFDFTAGRPGVAEMRLFLKSGGQTLSETWLYQYTTG